MGSGGGGEGSGCGYGHAQDTEKFHLRKRHLQVGIPKSKAKTIVLMVSLPAL